MQLHQTLEYMENTDPDCEQSGLIKRKILAHAAYYQDLLSQKRRRAMQSTLDRFFKKDKPSSSEAPTSNEPQSGTSTGGYTRSNVPSPPLLSLLLLPSSSDVDDSDII